MAIIKSAQHPCSIEIPDEIPACKQLIYGLVDPRNDQIYYVGRVRRDLVAQRMRGHCGNVYDFDIIRPAGIYWPKSFRLNERKVLIFNAGLVTRMTILALCDTDEEAIAAEKAIIKQHIKTVLNTQGK